MAIDDNNLLEHLERSGFRVGQLAGARVESAGPGNINFVRRVRLASGESFVVKHARPTLEKFPQYSAPTDRLRFEQRYVETVASLLGSAELLPHIVHFDAKLPLLIFEDLGGGPDLDQALRDGPAPLEALQELGHFLARVHLQSARSARALAPGFVNTDMQKLHGEHIFTLPYEPDAFPLDPAVRARADALLDTDLRERIRLLRFFYYEGQEALVHADVQSSNLLLRDGRLRLVDAEIAHFGDPAFDLGTTLAHVHVHIALAAQRTELADAADSLLDGYAKGGGGESALRRAPAHAGVELLRRTLGAARFACAAEPDAALRIVEHGARLVSSADL